MKKKVVLGSVMGAVALTVAACGSSNGGNSTTGNDAAKATEEVQVTEEVKDTEAPQETEATQEQGKTEEAWYELSGEDEVVTVRLPANETTGYQWFYTFSDEETLELVTQEYVQDEAEEGETGVGGTWVASFKGTFEKAGNVTLTLDYAQGETEEPEETKVLNLFVVENNGLQVVSAGNQYPGTFKGKKAEGQYEVEVGGETDVYSVEDKEVQKVIDAFDEGSYFTFWVLDGQEKTIAKILGE